MNARHGMSRWESKWSSASQHLAQLTASIINSIQIPCIHKWKIEENNGIIVDYGQLTFSHQQNENDFVRGFREEKCWFLFLLSAFHCVWSTLYCRVGV